jgi:hypothetical protein
LCAFGFFALSTSSHGGTPLVRTAHDRRNSSENLTFRLRRRLQSIGEKASWRKRWRYPRPSRPNEDTRNADASRASLYRLKTLLLAAEAGLLAGMAVRAGWFTDPCECVVARLLYASLVFSVGAVLLPLAIPVARSLRLNRLEAIVTPVISDGYLSLTPATLLAGVGAGVLAAENDLNHLGLTLLFGGALTGTLFGLSSMLDGLASKPSSQRPSGSMWASLFVAIGVYGMTVISNPERAARGLALIFAAPIVSVLVGVTLTPVLLRPFTMHHIFNRHLPIRLRALLAGFALSSLLPLGGVAAPFWIWARHRLWPRYERFAQQE